ncbi:L-tyrosine/L-tryptophan isonitrile synthase family protein [Sphingomonas sp. DG1-23]|uniref:L-tyrosine/L-tryptophan isonitrile synthase family protein n=1 Tax=Sphingomonas sp. DG1-23 TaxID=3068316 RepID=UPI002740079E|nr:L-tyrosine/L-tryptophan isonitrile synthase family protein [Sphingomonas sp. DG1-23]MDP5278773.1 L-tyrosine/L-tryptophan isonitrile synthase family protein [Sphingomonas sp. DG1-23]
MRNNEQQTLEKISYTTGLDRIQEAVISSHFMQKFSCDENLHMYSEAAFRDKRIAISSEFVIEKIVPNLLRTAEDFSAARAALAKIRAAEKFGEYGLAKASELGAANFIAELMFDRNYSQNAGKYFSRRSLANQISERIAAGEAITLAIPALPFKLPSPLKARGSSPDLAEVNFLLQLFEIAYGIDLLYREAQPQIPHACARFTVVSDGRRFNALVGQPDDAVTRYGEQIRWWIDRLGISEYVEVADYRDLLEARLPQELLRDKAGIRDKAEVSYAELMWPVFDPLHPLKSLGLTSLLEPDPEKLNPEGRFSSLLQSLVYTIRYPCLKRVAESAPGPDRSRDLALYRELTGHIFVRYPDAIPCEFDEVLLQAGAGDGLSPGAMESLRQAMLREVWEATILYMAEIKSDRELQREPISTCLPDAFRWTIHAKRGQIALMTPTALGLSVQAWAGTAVFKRSKKGGVKLCALPVVALEGVGSIPVTVQDEHNLFGLGDQPLFYIYPDIAVSSLSGLMDELTGPLVRARAV